MVADLQATENIVLILSRVRALGPLQNAAEGSAGAAAGQLSGCATSESHKRPIFAAYPPGVLVAGRKMKRLAELCFGTELASNL
jgi:hypothetical protein